MKKLLIATAALAMVAGTAQAQSSVTVYGILDIGYSDTKNTSTSASGASATNKITSTGNGDGGLATSRLGFRGIEDLGGGTKANFVLEYDLLDSGSQSAPAGTSVFPSGGTANASSFGARYSWVGLEDAKLGQLRLGRQESSAHSVVVAGSAGFANNTAGAIYSSGGNDTTFSSAAFGAGDTSPSVRPHQVFINKAVTYISPRINGFQAEAQMAKYEDKTNISGAPTRNDTSAAIGAAASKTEATGLSLKYAAGKFAAGYAYQQLKSSTLVANDATKYTVDVVSASYDFGIAKAFVLHAAGKDAEKTTQVGKNKNTEVGVQVPVGKAVLWASAFDGDFKSTGTSAQTFAFDTSGYQAGVRYDLSKRTALYGIYGEQERKGASVGTTGMKNETKQLTAGVRHSF